MPLDAVWHSIIPQHRCVEVYWHRPSDPPPPDALPPLAHTPRSDIALLLPYTATDPHLAAMVRVSPERFRRGDTLWGFYEAEQLVHVAWTRHDHRLDLTYELGRGALWPLPEPSVVLYDCYTLTAARGRRCYRRALATLIRSFAAMTTWIYTLDTNAASRKGILAAGFLPQQTHCRWRWRIVEWLTGR